jgi:Dyp-type peroxidase family
MEAETTAESQLALDQIQGNIAGFNKPHQRFVLLAFSDRDGGMKFIRGIRRQVDTAEAVAKFNRSFKWNRNRGRPLPTSRWFNIVISAKGLGVLEAPELEAFEPAFKEGMRARGARLGDVDESASESWIAPFQQDIHAVAILAADEPQDIDRLHKELTRHTQAHAVTEIGAIDGNVRSGEQQGHEHFGFKDGASQPGVEGLTEEPKPGQTLIPAGEFIFGYPALADEEPPPPPPGAYQPEPAPAPKSFPAWASNGSMFVLRRLRQNVKGFNDFVEKTANELGLSQELVGAKLVGRYKSGAPLELTKDEPESFDPQAADPSVADPSILDDDKINNFVYEPQDVDGHLVPRAAHIRKTNPRNQTPPGEAESQRHRILRRGIPYGSEFQPEENPYPDSGSPPDDQDRGLIFGCYQASIERGFEFIQSQWANQADFPQQGDGRDPIISQDVAEAGFSMPPDGHLTLLRWVITTGGEYFFAPSIDALKMLAGEGQP